MLCFCLYPERLKSIIQNEPFLSSVSLYSRCTKQEGGNKDGRRQTVLQMQEGDLEAFEELMQRNQRELLRLAYLISGNHADSEDIVQETFVQAYVKRASIREPEHVKSWLIRMMTRIAWRYLKKKNREHPVGDTMEECNPAGNELSDSVLKIVERREESEELVSGDFKSACKAENHGDFVLF